MLSLAPLDPPLTVVIINKHVPLTCVDYVCVNVTLIPASNKCHTSRRDEINSRSTSCELFRVDVA